MIEPQPWVLNAPVVLRRWKFWGALRPLAHDLGPPHYPHEHVISC